jgi:RNA polymerase sigma-70 factor, ECF subfamily
MTSAELEEMIRTHQAEIYRYLRYLGADRTTAEDIIQETFLAAFKSKEATLAEFELSRRAAWLRGTARNQLLAHWRRRRQYPTDPAALVQQMDDSEILWTSHFLRDGDGFDYVDALRECMDKLPEHQRRPIDLFYTQGKSRQEMAGLLKMTEDGIKSLLRRIRKVLGLCVSKKLNITPAVSPEP